jgi:hypothetical protein
MDMSILGIHQKDYVPYMGFQEEKHIPGWPDKETNISWANIYTCIANGKRVFVWAFKEGSRDTCCVMVSDFVTGRGAEIAEIRNMFADQHRRQKAARVTRTHRLPPDALVVQAFIYEVTLAGNEADDWIGVRT